jgi:predicted Ser/Thr protein kinase
VLLASLVCGAHPLCAEPSALPSPATRQVVFRTSPAGADVIIEYPPGVARNIGRSGEPITLDVAQFKEGYEVRLERAGYFTAHEHISAQYFLTHDAWPETGKRVLDAEAPWTPAQIALVALGIAGGAIFLGVCLMTLRERAVQHTVEILLSSGRMGTDTVVGNYRLIERLGRGGAAVVYRAARIDAADTAPVAIKVYRLDSRADESRRRVLKEIEIGQSLNHPNLVRVLEWGSIRKSIYIVLELVEGRTLRDMIPLDGFSQEQALRYQMAIMEAVAYAHSRGIVHRDLKPDNVLITDDEQVKLIDFGIARLESQSTETESGHIVGTFSYMAPERLWSADDPASDQYSLGIMAWELLCGETPFSSERPGIVSEDDFKKRMDAVLPPLKNGENKELEAIIVRMMAYEPQQRFPSVSAALEALRAHVGVGAS